MRTPGRTPSSRTVLPAAVLLVAAAPSGERIAPGYQGDEELTRSFVEELEWRLEAWESRVDGTTVEQDLDEARGSAERRLEVADEVRSAEAGQALEILRSFETIAASARILISAGGGEDLELETTLRSPLEGEEVVFSAEGDGGGFEVRLEGAGDDELLDGLAALLDPVDVLPPGEVEVEDAWELEPDALLPLLRPGGDLHLGPATVTQGSFETVPTTAILGSAMLMVAQAAEDLSGRVDAELEEIVEEDGRRLAQIAISFDVSSSVDRGERLGAWTALATEVDPDSVELRMEFELEGRAVVLWDLEAGRMDSFELEGELLAEIYLAWTEPMGDAEFAMEGEYEMSGQVRIEGGE